MTKGEQARLMAWRLRVLQQGADEQNVARVCPVMRRLGDAAEACGRWLALNSCYLTVACGSA